LVIGRGHIYNMGMYLRAYAQSNRG
jgi:hypothetical protein